LKVLHAAGKQIVIGNNEFLAVDTFEACGANADVFHGSRKFPHLDAIPNSERFIQTDCQAGKQVLDHILGSQADGNPAQTNARDHAGKVHIGDIIDHNEYHYDPDDHFEKAPKRCQR